MIETTTLIVLTTGIVQAIKKIGLSSRYAPIVSLVVGISLAMLSFLGEVSFGLRETILTGLVIGLSSSGLYSGGKALIKG